MRRFTVQKRRMKQNQVIKRNNEYNQNFVKYYKEFLVGVTSEQWHLGFGNNLK
jgi:hypothetical protein